MKLFRVTIGEETNFINRYGTLPPLQSEDKRFYPGENGTTFSSNKGKIQNGVFFYADFADAMKHYAAEFYDNNVENPELFSFDLPEESITASDFGLGRYSWGGLNFQCFLEKFVKKGGSINFFPHQQIATIEVLIDRSKLDNIKPKAVNGQHQYLKTCNEIQANGILPTYHENLKKQFLQYGLNLDEVVENSFPKIAEVMTQAQIGEAVYSSLYTNKLINNEREISL